jgi:hypothetical protein
MIPDMQRRAASFRLPGGAGHVARSVHHGDADPGHREPQPEEVTRPLTDLGNLGYVLLIVSGMVVAGRRRWPVPVFTAGLASLVYYGLDVPDGPAGSILRRPVHAYRLRR